MSEFWGSLVLVSLSYGTVREGEYRVLSNYTRPKLVFPPYQLICLSDVVLWGHIWGFAKNILSVTECKLSVYVVGINYHRKK